MTRYKFRAWRTSNANNSIGIMHENVGLLNGVVLSQKGDVLDRAILMQFTGLLDKNGKEIYEGDVLKSKENDELWRVDDIFPLHRHDHVTNIGYFEGKRFHPRDNPNAQYKNMDDWMSWPEMYEIIGNIYKNPNLLTTDNTTKV